MSREDVLLKLVALEPDSRATIVASTGWGIEAANAVVDQLLGAGRLAYWPQNGNNMHGGQILCTPAARDARLDWLREQAREIRRLADTSPHRSRAFA